MPTFQEILRRLALFWEQQGCIIHQGYDLEMGAGTFNPATFLRALGPEPYRAAYIEPSRRPADGRYGENPNRTQHYFQYQVILKPSPPDIQELYLKSLEAIGFHLKDHDIRFVHDDWEGPTLGAWGMGWEVWLDGMEITQFTYFQSVGGQALKPITGEITYGLERVAMYLQKVDNFFDLKWNEQLTYGDLYKRNEIEWSRYNFEEASTDMWLHSFEEYEKEAKKLIEKKLPIPAFDFVLKASHAFNMLDARRYISVTERTGYIARIRALACAVAEAYVASRAEQGYPLLKYAVDEPALPPLRDLPAILTQQDPLHKMTFLLEIGTEELPTTFVPIGMSQLEQKMRQLFTHEGLRFDDLKIFGTPRRIAIEVLGLQAARPATSEERRGPALERAFDSTGNLSAAGEGFFRSLGLQGLTLQGIQAGQFPQVVLKEQKGVQYLFVTHFVPSKSAAEILAEQLPKLILGLEFPKTMHWGNHEISFPRPLRWIVALLDDSILPLQVGPVYSSNVSQGHRQRSPGSVIIPHARQYVRTLLDHQVMVDVGARRESILDQIVELEKELNMRVIEKERVLPQVLNLVEWPTLTHASFSGDFLKAPSEVLISPMVEHQKYFPLEGRDGRLANSFVITCDTQPTDLIRTGNQKVLSARLSDGLFLYHEDLKTPLDAFAEKLKNVLFQKELGSVHDKVERIIAHSRTLHALLPLCAEPQLLRAAQLCKADLASHVVGEFPELQGIMGRIYAHHQQEDAEVAQAIEEHWMPRSEGGSLPVTGAGTLLSIAEKLDNLLGCFSVGLKPTSSSDPYGLRRQILAIVRILIQGKHRLPLDKVLAECLSHFPEKYRNPAVLEEIHAFITNRIKTVFLEYGFNKDEIEASLSTGITDIYDTFCKVKALHEFRDDSHFSLLFEVYKRAKGQLNSEKSGVFSAALLQEPAEIQLNQALDSFEGLVRDSLTQHNYAQAYKQISELQLPLHTLFEQVKILSDDENVRRNRLALLHRVFCLFNELLDFSKIQEK